MLFQVVAIQPSERCTWAIRNSSIWSRPELHDHLDDLAPGNAQVVPLEIGALDARLLRLRHVDRHTACDEEHRYGHEPEGFHVNVLCSGRSRDGGKLVGIPLGGILQIRELCLLQDCCRSGYFRAVC
jgi:hypothetical protein